MLKRSKVNQFITESWLVSALGLLGLIPKWSCVLARGRHQGWRKKTNYVHSETSYFVSGKLNQKRVDITVVKPSNYDFRNEEVVYRKGYHFAEPSIGIELKLNKNGSKKRVEDELKADLDNMRRLKRNKILGLDVITSSCC